MAKSIVSSHAELEAESSQEARRAPAFMSIVWRLATLGCGIALLGLATLNLAYRDGLLQWQPLTLVPGMRAPIGIASGGVLLVGGLSVLSGFRRSIGLRLASIWIGLWVLALHLPVWIATGGGIPGLLGVAECSGMAIGLTAATVSNRRYLRLLSAGLGTCMIVYGLSHFAYAKFTAQMVPAWLPARLALAYLTGTIHIAAGVLLIAGAAPIIAAAIEAAMMLSFVLLVHLPGVASAPTNRLQWTMLFIALLLTSSVAQLAARWASIGPVKSA
ncbi:MAG TPA: hypothetical protein VN137_15140 [Sphingomonas sp.]|nr:hypothetical protein [Sphingomonas sp.]